MTWVTNFDSAFWKIETTGVSVEGYNFWTWEKSFIRITCKDVSAHSVLTVISFDEQDYEFFVDGEKTVIEITDIVRAYSGGTIEFFNQIPSLVYEMDWVSVPGERMTQSNREELPEEIPYNIDSDIPFYFQFTEVMQSIIEGVWTDWTDSVPGEKELTAAPDEIRTKVSNDYTRFVNMPCWNNMLLVEWVSHLGLKKSWWFEVSSELMRSTRQLNIQTLNNGYNTLKNKTKSLILFHKLADRKTQAYLSDIVLSDDVCVFFTNEEQDRYPVRIENDSFEITKRKRDILLTVNTFAYDTI